MAGDDFFHEARFGIHHREQGLLLFGLGSEGDEVHRVPGTHGHSHFGVKFEATNAGAMSSPGVNHDDGPRQRVDRHALGRHQAQQSVVAGFGQIVAVHHHLMRKFQ